VYIILYRLLGLFLFAHIVGLHVAPHSAKETNHHTKKTYQTNYVSKQINQNNQYNIL
jgi:hypothetical protein